MLCQRKLQLHCNYLKYSHQIGSIEFTILFPPNEPNFFFLAPLLTLLANLVILFILQVTYIANSVYQMENK